MLSKNILLLLFLALLVSQGFSARIMTSEELNELNAVEGKAMMEKENACGRQCLIDGGWDPDAGILPNANLSVKCNIECSSDPCTQACRPECSNLDCYAACEAPCHKAQYEACDAECAGYENTSSNFYLQRCTCVCKKGYVPGSSGCVEDDGSGGNGNSGSGNECTGPECSQQEQECNSLKPCPGGQFCKDNKCVGKGSLNVSIDKRQLYHGKVQDVTITAQLTGGNEADIVFEIMDEEKALAEQGYIMAIEETSGGKAKVTLTLPRMGTNNYVNNKPDIYPYTLPVRVTAQVTSESDRYMLTASDSITLLSPLPKIESISVNPPTSQAFGPPVTILVSISDPDGEPGDEYRYLFDAQGYGAVQKTSDGEQAKRYLDKQTSLKSSILYYAPEIGLNVGEAVFAKEMMEHYKSLGISCSIKGGELVIKQGVKMATKGSGRFVPVISTVLQAKEVGDSVKRGIDKVSSFSDSSNAKEVIWRSVDLGLEGVRGCVGTVCYFATPIPGIGQLGEIAQTGVDTALAAGQASMQVLISKEKEKEAVVRTKKAHVYVKIKDPDGYTTITYDEVEIPVSYLWAKGVKEE